MSNMNYSLKQDNITSEPVYTRFPIEELVTFTTLTGAVTVFGVVGNLLTVIIMTKQINANSMNIILLSLAVADLLFLVSTLLKIISKIVDRFNKPLALTIGAYNFAYVMVVNATFTFVSMTHILVIALHRFLAIYFPFQVSLWVTTRKMIAVALSVHVFWIVALIPLMFVTEIEWILVESLNRTVATPKFSEFHKNNKELMDLIYYNILMVCTGPVFNTIVLVLCVAASIKLYKTVKARRAMVNLTERPFSMDHIKAARMLIVVCFVYLFTTLPPAVLRLLAPPGQPENLTNCGEVKNSVSVLLWCINSSANFVIYILMSKRFNNALSAMFCSCRR